MKSMAYMYTMFDNIQNVEYNSWRRLGVEMLVCLQILAYSRLWPHTVDILSRPARSFSYVTYIISNGKM